MKIRPVILCGGAGTRLWPKKSKHQAKQFIVLGSVGKEIKDISSREAYTQRKAFCRC